MKALLYFVAGITTYLDPRDYSDECTDAALPRHPVQLQGVRVKRL